MTLAIAVAQFQPINIQTEGDGSPILQKFIKRPMSVQGRRSLARRRSLVTRRFCKV